MCSGCDTARKQYPPKTGTDQEYFINAEKFFAKNLVKDFSANIIKSATIDPSQIACNFFVLKHLPALDVSTRIELPP
jgi:hypothetical protein